jgi:hypothetical protein
MRMNDYNFETGIDGFISEILAYGTDDYIQAAEIVNAILFLEPIFRNDVSSDILHIISEAKKLDRHKKFEIIRKLNFSIIKRLLTDELIVVLGEEPYLDEPWSLSVEESLLKLQNYWDDLHGELPCLGVYWLKNTPKGDVIGEWESQRWKRWVKKEKQEGVYTYPSRGYK